MYFCYRLDDVYVHCHYVNEAEYLSYEEKLKDTFIIAFLLIDKQIKSLILYNYTHITSNFITL